MNADLITALERGPGSRELSDQVLLAQGFELDYVLIDILTFRSPNKLLGWQPGSKRPDPTRNLQDAVDLVPAGWGWGKNVHEGRMYVLRTDDILFAGEQDDPRLSLCIALLRAAQTKGREE